MYLLVDVAATGSQFPVSAVAALVVGFIAAASIGSAAWYASKRPVGWKDKE